MFRHKCHHQAYVNQLKRKLSNVVVVTYISTKLRQFGFNVLICIDGFSLTPEILKYYR
jgi:hypothetical protein